MKVKLAKALQSLNIDFPLADITVKKANRTILEKDVLYIKSIPHALRYITQDSDEQLKHELDTIGTMIDLSRNAVFSLDYFKKVIKKQAALGYNEIWLYMEDVYTLTKYPKFGYLRGAYTKEDLQILVNYAEQFDVKLVPCIQTLGHMSQFLRWSSSSQLRDQANVLLAGSDQTYEFIAEMIAFCRNTFKINKIHIGMDETFGLGLGQFYKNNGFVEPKVIFMSHLLKVNQICLDYDYKEVMIWSDMFFRMESPNDEYYNPGIEFNDAYIKRIPENVSLVYWDYYNTNETVYYKMLKKHLDLGKKVIMASGTWIWTKINYDKTKTDQTALNAIRASKSLGIKEIIFTQWQDDGAYCDYETSYLGLYDMMNAICEYNFDISWLPRFGIEPYDVLLAKAKINNLSFDPIMLLWDDLLLGIYLNDLVGFDVEQMEKMIVEAEHYRITLPNNKTLDHTKAVMDVLISKLKFRKKFINYYNNKVAGDEIIKLANQLIKETESLYSSFTKMWHSRYRLFGLEELQNRIYAQIGRVKEAKWLIKAYQEGKVKQIPFLEETIKREPYLSQMYSNIAKSTKL